MPENQKLSDAPKARPDTSAPSGPDRLQRMLFRSERLSKTIAFVSVSEKANRSVSPGTSRRPVIAGASAPASKDRSVAPEPAAAAGSSGASAAPTSPISTTGAEAAAREEVSAVVASRSRSAERSTRGSSASN